MNNNLKLIICALVALFLLVLSGLANLRNYQARVSIGAMVVVRAHLDIGANENVLFSHPDYSLSAVQFFVTYKNEKYYVVVIDKNHFILVNTVFNLFLSPNLEIVNVDKQ